MAPGRLELCALWLVVAASPARAQCGARLSQCRNCHEIAGARPVLAGGAPWHRDHAFGDFCAQCHFGDPEATDKTAAHARVTSPLAAIELSCGPCHPSDADALADRYLKQPPVAPAPLARPARARSTAGNIVLAGLVVVV
ncbi:MAG: hypothetical protein ACHQ53_19000, partial [Polyangiales bacterium]